MKPFLAMALAAGLLLAADGSKEDASKEEAKKLHGTWVVVSCETDGEKVPKEILEKEVVRFIIDTDEITINVDWETKSEDRYKLDQKADPRTIDLTDQEGRKALGIYSLDGDKLQICLSERGKVRPTAFATKPGSGFDLWVLKREEPGKTDQERIQGTWKVVDVTVSGKKVEGTELGEKGVLHLATLNLLFIFGGDKWEGKALDKTQSQGTVKLDPGRKPKTIDLRIADGEGTGLGIYRLEGNKLTLCFPDRGKEGRPAEFRSTEENKSSLFILERTK